MALLSDQQRIEVWKDLMERASAANIVLNVADKNDLLTAVINTDVFQDSNAASYNAVLPATVQAGLTAKLKNDMFTAVAKKRWEGQ